MSWTVVSPMAACEADQNSSEGQDDLVSVGAADLHNLNSVIQIQMQDAL